MEKSLREDEKKVERRTSAIDRCVEFLERENGVVSALAYGITGVGLSIALFRIRPFAKFTRPTDVPARFVKLRTPLRGTAVEIEPTRGALIMVDHEPLIPLPRFGNPRHLPVKIAGVNVTTNGVSWLRTVVLGKRIEFVPVARKNDYLDCAVSLRESSETTTSVGEELVRLGFGTVGDLESVASNDQLIISYRAALNAAQRRARRERNGYWHSAIDPTYLWKLGNFVRVELSKILPTRISNRFGA